jgi:serine O-acetyltransferase
MNDCSQIVEQELLKEASQKKALPTGGYNENPVGMSLWALWREDLQNHYGSIWEQGFWALAVHRFGNWRMSIRPKILRFPFSLLYKILNKWVEWTCGISLPYTVKVGRRVRLWHHGGMILHARSIGDDCHIRQNTTFGVARTDDNTALPVIGNRVDIGCNSCILGAIHIGHGAVIGAGAVVLKDIPPGAKAVGVPARVLMEPSPSNAQSIGPAIKSSISATQ